jgi:uncharacterized membrane protein
MLMNIRWIIYFIGILDNIISGFIALSSISGIFLFIILLVYFFSYLDGLEDLSKTYEKTKTFFILSFLSLILFLTLTAFTPSSKLIAKIINNEEIQKIPNNALKLLNSKMEEWIEDIPRAESNVTEEYGELP